MTLLGGACKFSGTGSPSGAPNFSGDPYIVFDSTLGPSFCMAGIEIDSDGAIEAIKSGGNQGDIGRWDGGNSLDKNDYEFRLQKISGDDLDVVGDAQNTWHGGGGVTVFRVSRSGIGNEDFVGQLRMRPAGGGSIIDTAATNLHCETEP